jgi:hypothetical protein
LIPQIGDSQSDSPIGFFGNVESHFAKPRD